VVVVVVMMMMMMTVVITVLITGRVHPNCSEKMFLQCFFRHH